MFHQTTVHTTTPVSKMYWAENIENYLKFRLSLYSVIIKAWQVLELLVHLIKVQIKKIVQPQWAVVVAQLVEWLLPIPEIRGSNPVIGKIY